MTAKHHPAIHSRRSRPYASTQRLLHSSDPHGFRDRWWQELLEHHPPFLVCLSSPFSPPHILSRFQLDLFILLGFSFRHSVPALLSSLAPQPCRYPCLVEATQRVHPLAARASLLPPLHMSSGARCDYCNPEQYDQHQEGGSRSFSSSRGSAAKVTLRSWRRATVCGLTRARSARRRDAHEQEERHGPEERATTGRDSSAYGRYESRPIYIDARTRPKLPSFEDHCKPRKSLLCLFCSLPALPWFIQSRTTTAADGVIKLGRRSRFWTPIMTPSTPVLSYSRRPYKPWFLGPSLYVCRCALSLRLQWSRPSLAPDLADTRRPFRISLPFTPRTPTSMTLEAFFRLDHPRAASPAPTYGPQPLRGPSRHSENRERPSEPVILVF
ncbi:hypothetical protein C8R45DRAFT_1112622 [Mycena sanguinolenta]|nr:hypothetical protein C8R45DRAFT_1112622 [Mycena sanguinolenta]